MAGSKDFSIPLTRCPLFAQTRIPLTRGSASSLPQAHLTYTKIEAEFIYFGTRLISSKMEVAIPSKQGHTVVLDLSSHYVSSIEEDLQKLMKSLGRSDSGLREFRCVQLDPPVYVYTFQNSEQISNSSVTMFAWDNLASINVEHLPLPSEEVIPLNLDVEPFFLDNCELAALRSNDTLLNNVVSGASVTSCNKYYYTLEHFGIGWDEATWAKRLYWCIKEQEVELSKVGVTVADVSGDGPNWQNRLPTLFHCPDFCSQFTIYKGVTDILLIGKNRVGIILVTSMETENILQKITAGEVAVEISLSKPKMVDCKINGERCPSKLAELLSSMYLIGVMSIMTTKIENLSRVVVYGWLIFRGAFSMAVKLEIGRKCCLASVLWQKSNILSNMSDHFQFFLKCISQE